MLCLAGDSSAETSRSDAVELFFFINAIACLFKIIKKCAKLLTSIELHRRLYCVQLYQATHLVYRRGRVFMSERQCSECHVCRGETICLVRSHQMKYSKFQQHSPPTRSQTMEELFEHHSEKLFTYLRQQISSR